MSLLRTILLSSLLVVVLTAAGSSPPESAKAAPRATYASLAGDAGGSAAGVAGDTVLARAVLKDLAATYRDLDDVSIVFGATPNDAEAVAYYTHGKIVINPAHAVGIEKILEHEIWHVIDWRDNGRIDWGESVPPVNAATYLQ